jgi:hypothetical protein
MKRMRKRCRFWIPTGVLLLSLLATLLTSNVAAGTATRPDHIPRKLWSTYPLDPSRGQARIDRRPAASDASESARKEHVAPTTSADESATQERVVPTTSAGGKSVAHYAPWESSTNRRVYVIAIALVATLAVLGVILARRSASRPVRNFAGALPLSTIMAYASVIILSVAVGIGVVLILSPALGP